MPVPGWLTELWRVAQTAMPWVTGGLAGSVVTYLLAQRLRRKSTPQLFVKTKTTEYALPAVASNLKRIQVRYGDEDFERLALYELSVENTSSRTCSAAPFLIQLSGQSRVVDRTSSVLPINRPVSWSTLESMMESYLWDPGELKPRDSARLHLLVSPLGRVKVAFRGDDEVDIVSDTVTSPSHDEQIRSFIVWVALYLALGVIPFLSAALRSLLLLFSITFILLIFERLRSAFVAMVGPRMRVDINELSAESVSFATEQTLSQPMRSSGNN